MIHYNLPVWSEDMGWLSRYCLRWFSAVTSCVAAAAAYTEEVWGMPRTTDHWTTTRWGCQNCHHHHSDDYDRHLATGCSVLDETRSHQYTMIIHLTSSGKYTC